jgi:hypothetical protein
MMSIFCREILPCARGWSDFDPGRTFIKVIEGEAWNMSAVARI